MTFKEALAAKENNTRLEYEMRAARIANWVREQEGLDDEFTEALYSVLKEEIADSKDEFDETAYEILEELRFHKSE